MSDHPREQYKIHIRKTISSGTFADLQKFLRENNITFFREVFVLDSVLDLHVKERIKKLELLLKMGSDPNKCGFMILTVLMSRWFQYPLNELLKCTKLFLEFGAHTFSDCYGSMFSHMSHWRLPKKHKKLITIMLIRAGGDPFLVHEFEMAEPRDECVLELINKVPKVRNLSQLCLSVIHFGKKQVVVPEWFPPLLLEWGDGLD